MSDLINLQKKSSSSSGVEERLTIAYTETIPSTPSFLSDESSTPTVFSESTDSTSTHETTTSLFAELDEMTRQEAFFGYEPVRRTASLADGPQLFALHYFHTHYVFQLFSFLMSHVLANRPDEPVTYLLSLVNRCLHYRDEGADPPLLFEDSHVHSVYTALDPMGDGTITYQQYLAGINTLGLTDFNIMPDDKFGRNSNVPKETFTCEAKRALLIQLDKLLGKSQPRASQSLEVEVERNFVNYDADRLSELYHRSKKGSRNASSAKILDDSRDPGDVSPGNQWRPSRISFKLPPILSEQ